MPAEIVKKAIGIKLKAIALTDHDSVEGVEGAISVAPDSIEVIPAVEMSANIGDLDIHILGYYIDHTSDELNTFLEDFRIYRLKRVDKILRKLSSDGINIDRDHVIIISGNGSIGRPHIAEAMRQSGYVHSINEAFIRYLGYHSRYYEPKKEIKPKEVIQKIKKCKGIPVIAHPGTVGGASMVYQLIMDGIMGIEVWHPEHTRQQESELCETAMKNGLLMTGGSDYHGYPRSRVDMGKYGCSMEEVRRLKETRQ